MNGSCDRHRNEKSFRVFLRTQIRLERDASTRGSGCQDSVLRCSGANYCVSRHDLHFSKEKGQVKAICRIGNCIHNFGTYVRAPFRLGMCLLLAQRVKNIECAEFGSFH